MENLIKAFIKAKSEFKPILKDGVNPHYKKRYVTLDGVLSAVEPALLKNGLAVFQTTDLQDGLLVLKTHLFHTSGECLSSTYLLPSGLEPQKLGSAITYARRYGLCALLCVTADEDDDGEAATPRPVTGESNASKGDRIKAAREKAGLTTEDVRGLMQSQYGKANPSQLTSEQVNELIALVGDMVGLNAAVEMAEYRAS
jgi:hypothetical protein